MKPKYPWSMFFIGIILNIIKMWLLDVVALALIFSGIFNPVLLKFGVSLAICILLYAVIQQFIYRNNILKDPTMSEWFTGDGTELQNFMDHLDKQIKSGEPLRLDTDEDEEDTENKEE